MAIIWLEWIVLDRNELVGHRRWLSAYVVCCWPAGYLGRFHEHAGE